MKRNLALILIAALLITPRFASADAVIGTDVSAFASTSVITGNAVSGSVFAASDITVLHYFSTFCDNLIPEIQYMQRAYIEYAGAVNVLGLLYEDSLSTAEGAKALFEEYDLSYDCIHIDEVLSPIVNHYNYIPQTFIVSRDGIIIEHFPGTLPDYNTLEEMILHWVDGSTTSLDVTFIDGLTDEIIEVQQIPYGADAVLPLPPVHEGYEFSYWEGDYTGITAPTEITAVYEPVSQHIPGDADGNGSIEIADAVLVLRYSMELFENEIIPFCCDLSGDGAVTVGDAILVLRLAMGLA